MIKSNLPVAGWAMGPYPSPPYDFLISDEKISNESLSAWPTAKLAVFLRCDKIFEKDVRYSRLIPYCIDVNGKDVMCLKDHEIIALFFERSEQAITELILKYGAAIRSVASNILNNAQDVEECSNDTYLHVWNRIPPTRPDHLGAYVCRIARNVSLKRYASNTAEKRNSHYDVALQELEATIPALSTVESDYDAKELTGYLNRFLKGLSKEDRYLFMRRYWYGDGIKEIAQNLDIAPHAASVRLFRLRQKLLTLLQKEGMIA